MLLHNFVELVLYGISSAFWEMELGSLENEKKLLSQNFQNIILTFQKLTGISKKECFSYD